MKILLLGGTGAMGVHLVELLAKRGDEVYVTSRKKRDNKNNVTYFKGNAKNIDFINPILKSYYWDAIVDFMTYHTEEFNKHIDDLLSATKQYIYLSSSRVYAQSNNGLTEDSPRLLDISNDKDFLNTDDYALYKAREENILTNHAKYNNFTIIRPYITYSETRLPLGILEKETWIYRALHGRSIVFPKDIASKFTTLAYGLDVSKIIVQIIRNDKMIGQTINIVSNKSEKWEDILNLYVEELNNFLGDKPKVVMTDKTPRALSLGFKFKLKQLLKSFITFFNIPKNKFKIVPNYQLKYDRLFNRTFNNYKLIQCVDSVSFCDNNDQLRKCIQRFIKNPQYSFINWNKEAIHDHISGDKTPLKEIKSIRYKMSYILIRYLIPLKWLQ